ncbi:hypothetical protein MN116_008927 [Schistosoma mekongi]|uniref:Uncharacterized protein n=1 Tax=Schistosoma mekongi TaxID=38744 RepID=A0AAE1Z5K0_SCHME|nr:hypothetical protein MN116_008927 [Schistosoma mekongi]
MKDSLNTNDSRQYTRQYNQNEIENVKIHNLNEIYPYAVSRRPSVRDILRQQINSFMHSQQHKTEKHQIYYPKQNRYFPSKESSNHLSTTTSATTTTTTTSTDDDDNHNKMLKSLERSDFYTSNDYINYPQLNLCVSRIDYLFSDHNLNMGVIPPPNLNPFTS